MKVFWMCVVLGLCVTACGEEIAPEQEDTTQDSKKPGKGDVIVEGDAEPESRFGNFEVEGELALATAYVMDKKGLFLGDEARLGEADGVSCLTFDGAASCDFKTSSVEIIGSSTTDYTIWFQGEGAESLYSWMSELAEEDESITARALARGDEYVLGNVSCSWSSGTAPGCFVLVGDESLATSSMETLARAGEGFLVLNGALASGIGVVLEEAGRITQMPSIDLKVGEADGVRCSYDLEDVPMCELDASQASLFSSGLDIQGDVAVELYSLMDEVEASGSERVTRGTLASGELLTSGNFSCTWLSGYAPTCFVE